MNPTITRRVGIVLLWILFCIILGWIFYPRYNVPEPPPRLDTKLPSSSSTGH